MLQPFNTFSFLSDELLSHLQVLQNSNVEGNWCIGKSGSGPFNLYTTQASCPQYNYNFPVERFFYPNWLVCTRRFLHRKRHEDKKNMSIHEYGNLITPHPFRSSSVLGSTSTPEARRWTIDQEEHIQGKSKKKKSRVCKDNCRHLYTEIVKGSRNAYSFPVRMTPR